MDDDHEILVLVFDETLNVGEGVLVIEFSGILSEHLRGYSIDGAFFFPLFCHIILSFLHLRI